MRRIIVMSSALLMAVAPAVAQEDAFSGRPGLALPEQPAAEVATCDNVGRTIRGFKSKEDERVDLWVSGPITIERTDGVLWYIGICSVPGIRVLCVTYSDNGMKAGDIVTLRGAMRIEDEKHILLDPCLAAAS